MQDKNACCEWFEWADPGELLSGVAQPHTEAQSAIQPPDNEAAESLPQPAELEFVKVCLQLEEIKRKNDKLKMKVEAESFKKNVAMMAVVLSWVVTVAMFFSVGKP